MTSETGTLDESARTRATIDRFTAALDRGDVDAAVAEMTDDVVYEDSSPFPDGEAFTGRAAVREQFARILGRSNERRFETEELVVAGDRCSLRWVSHWIDPQGNAGHVRGVALFRLRDGLICEKLDYIKG